MRFDTPYAFAIVVPLVLALLVTLRKRPTGLSRTRQRLFAVSIVIAVIAAALSAVGLAIPIARDALAVVVVVDRSRSTESGTSQIDARLEEIRRATRAMRIDDRVGLVVVGSEALTVLAPSPRTELPSARADVSREASNLEAGIRHALADVPEGTTARVVLITDGLETHGDGIAAASAASARGVPVDVVPILRTPSPEVAVESVRAPTHAATREPIALRVVTRSTRATRVRLRLRRDDTVIAVGEAAIGAGHDLLVVRDVPAEAGLHRYDVELEPLEPGVDASRANDRGAAFVRVEGSARTLLVGESEAAVAPLAAALRAGGTEPVVVDGANVPLTLAELASFDLVALVDVPATALTEAQIENLGAYVRDLGGGLLMAGARKSFGLGGYSGTAIEDVMPVTFDLRRRRDRLSLSLVIAIDRSGSMSAPVDATRTKLDLANEAAARSALLLSPSDRVAIAHIDTEVHWTQPMTRVENPARIAAAARHATSGGGGILVDVTLDAAYAALLREPSQLLHLILFSDGSDSEQMEGCRERVARAYARRITTTVVSMGNGPDTAELEQLARIGHGRFYIVEDMTQLPRIFTQETMEASRAGVAEKTFRAAVVEHGPAIDGIDFEASPMLHGLALVEPRPDATVHLRAAASEPLLARTQHGLGRTAVLTTDLGGELARDWLAWPGFRAMLGQLTRDLARREAPSDVDVRVDVESGRGRIWVEAISEDGRFRNHLGLEAHIASPRGGTERIQLEQTSPGRYEATFDASVPGPYLATVRDDTEGLVGTVGAVRAYASELTGEGTDHVRIAEIASAGGGEVRRDVQDLFTRRGAPIVAHVPAAPYLLPVALLALLASVIVRRLTYVPAVFARLLARRARAPSTAESTVPDTMESLAASARARREQTPGGRYEPLPADAMPVPAEPVEAVPAPTESPAKSDPKAKTSLAERLLEERRKR